MRVLLTGASGFLGANMLRYLLDTTPWQIVCPASFRHRGVPERITLSVAPEEWERVEVVTCDLAAPIADTTATLFGDIDVIINFASESSIPRSLAAPAAFVANNVGLMVNLLDYARTLPRLQAFIHVSTDEVYGPRPAGAHAEWSAIVPSTPYSASKAAQEALGIAYWRSYDVPLIVVNTMNPLGPMQDPEKYLPSLIAKVWRGEVVTVHTGPDGRPGSRVYVHARDLATAIAHVLALGPRSCADAARPQRWNVVGERDVDNLELAEMVAREIDLPMRTTWVTSDVPGHGLRYALDGAELAAAGWKPARPIEATVAELVAWSRVHPMWRDRRP